MSPTTSNRVQADTLHPLLGVLLRSQQPLRRHPARLPHLSRQQPELELHSHLISEIRRWAAKAQHLSVAFFAVLLVDLVTLFLLLDGPLAYKAWLQPRLPGLIVHHPQAVIQGAAGSDALFVPVPSNLST